MPFQEKIDVTVIKKEREHFRMFHLDKVGVIYSVINKIVKRSYHFNLAEIEDISYSK